MSTKIAVDGSNLCAVDSAPKSTFRLDRLVYAIDQLKKTVPGADLKVFVDANLRYKLSTIEKSELEDRIRAGEITQSPAGITADDFILDWAHRNAALVISNDQFKQYHSVYPWLIEQGGGRSITAIFDDADRTWTFLERRAGSAPARPVASIVSSYQPAPIAVTAPVVVQTSTEAYTKRISRRTPAAFVLLVDQSGSMAEAWQEGISKAEQVATIVNSALKNLVLQATSNQVVYDYADVAIIGYGGVGSDGVRSLLPGTSIDSPFSKLSEIARQPTVTVLEPIGGPRTQVLTWFTPTAGGGTPMNRAFTVVRNALDGWVSTHQESFPPIVINITDGESTDSDPSSVVRDITGLETIDGNVLVFTAFIGTGGGKQELYPSALPAGMSTGANNMFEISSVVPEPLRSSAEGLGILVKPTGRGFLFNAKRDEVSGLVNFGTSLRTPEAHN
jgi:uncharacterized protein YegL